MRIRLFILFLFISILCKAQYSFSGEINPSEWDHSVYLSIVEDYRKLGGIYTNQVIAKTKADSLGFFKFTGNHLDKENRIYRIHIDKCTEEEQEFKHFNGYCEESKELLFIGNNSDTLYLPFTQDNEIFCLIESNNPNADALTKIAALKNEMRFAYSEVKSEASKKLNNRSWFQKLQEAGKAFNEPIAELAIYAYLSDRGNEFYDYYLEDLKESNYYEALLDRIETRYPGTNYATQYKEEIKADLYTVGAASNKNKTEKGHALLYVLLFISLTINAYLVYKNYNKNTSKTIDLTAKLSKQEQVVLNHILKDKTNKEIAEILFLSVSTVKSHTNHIYKKLNVQNREGAKSLFTN